MIAAIAVALLVVALATAGLHAAGESFYLALAGGCGFGALVAAVLRWRLSRRRPG